MTDIETLTEDEHGALSWYGREANQVGLKALRIIDALTEALAARDVCWHCKDVLTPEVPRCDRCPAPGDCDDMDCKEDGCQPP